MQKTPNLKAFFSPAFSNATSFSARLHNHIRFSGAGRPPLLFLSFCWCWRMGCVLGKTDAEDRRRGRGVAGFAVQNGLYAARVRREKKPQKSAHPRGDFASGVWVRRPRPEPSAWTEHGWPSWLVAVAGDAIHEWTPRCADTFQKLEKIGHGTYSNVYKARDKLSGNIVAMKKVRFDASDPSSLKFMAREICILKRLNHPNVIKLEGLATSRMSCGLYLVFEYMEHDLAGLAGREGFEFTESQVKCYVKQLLSGLEHCHNNGVLHRDIKCSNLLINDEGILKIADFGLAAFFDPARRQPMTSKVVTLWYRPPELLLGVQYYGIGIDLWSAGCIVGELLAGRAIFPGRTEVEQLHKIFKLCGTPSEEYWKKLRVPNASLFKPKQKYKRCVLETFKDFPQSSLLLIDKLLSIDPERRGTATAALNSEFFTSKPYACEPSNLPKYMPSKEMDLKLRDEQQRRQRGVSGKFNAAHGARTARNRASRAIPAPEANAEVQANLDRWRVVTQANAMSKSEKFPPPHEDGAVGHTTDTSLKDFLSFGPPNTCLSSATRKEMSSGSISVRSAGFSGFKSSLDFTWKNINEASGSRRRTETPSNVQMV